MGLYDEGVEAPESSNSDNDNEPVGKMIATINKKPLKDKENKRIPAANSRFELPDWVRPLAIGVVALILILVIGFAIYLGFKADYLSIKINPNPSFIIDDSSSTKLTVNVTNINDFDLKNLELTVSPVDKMSIAVIPSDARKIAILGANEKREFVFDMSSIGIINPGEYGVNVTLKTSEGVITEQIFWEIKTHK